jgi:prepilin-type N-terminal cleavage/methylation domain-containing protein
VERSVTRAEGVPVRDDEESSDAGYSLIELIVAMTIFTIFIAVFLAAVVGLARGTTQARASSESAGGVMLVFQNIDRQVRYADAINFPGASSATGYRYIEFRTPASSMPTNETTCTQWRFLPDQKRIESRRWKDTPGSVATPWATKLATVISKPDATYPFALIPAAGPSKQQLQLSIDAGLASGSGKTSISTSFVARNSSDTSVSNTAGPDGQSVNRVCDRTDFRP